MQSKIYATLWRITGLVAIGLLIATLALAYHALRQPETVLTGVLSGHNPTIYLRSEPSGNSQIVTILERGGTVVIADTITNQDILWLKIKTGQFTGWIPETNITFEGQ